MALVLAIEPDPRQAAVVKEVITRHLNAEALMTVSKDAALAALAMRLPDILLVTTLLSPRDESEITDSLRTLDQAGAVPMLSIPLLLQSKGENETSPKLLKAVKRRRKSAETAGCEPSVFAGQIRSYLECAQELRAEWQARQAGQAGGERGAEGAVVAEEAPAIAAVVPEPVAPVDFAVTSAMPAIEMSTSWVDVLEALTVQPDLTADRWDHASAWFEQLDDAALTAALAAEPEAFVSASISGDELWQALFDSPDPTPTLESFVSVDPFMLARLRAMSAEGRSSEDAPEPTLVFAEAEIPPAPKPAPAPEARKPKRRRAATRVRKALPLKPEEPEVYELPATLESMDRSDGDDGLTIDVPLEPHIASRSFDAAQRRPEPVEERQAPPVASPQTETISASIPSVVPIQTPSATLDHLRQGYGGPPKLHAKAESADAEWMARELDVLRARVEQLQAEREAQAEALRDGTPRQRDATGRPIAAPKPDRLTSPRRRRAKPITDEWGIHDPDRCGFTALFARLDALDAQPSTLRPGSGRPESIEGRTRDTRSHPLDQGPAVSGQAPAAVAPVPKADLPARGRRSAAVSAAPRLSPLAAWARTFRPSIVERGAPVGFSQHRNRGDHGQPVDRQQESPVDDCAQLLAGLNVPHPVAAITFPTGCRIRRVRVTTPPARPTSPQDALVVILSRKLLAQIRQQSRVWYHAPAGAHEQIA